MKRTISLLLIPLLLVTLPSCVKEQFGSTVTPGRGEGYVYLHYGSEPAIEVTTRATLPASSENRIMNMYVFVFDASGHKVHNKWFDELDRKSSIAELSTSNECWYRENSSDSAVPSTGVLKIKAPEGSGFRIYIFANLDGDMVKISSEMLSHNIETEDDLLNFQVYLNQEVVSRNGYFPMTGRIYDVTITDGQDINSDTSPLILKRLDAKIKFTFKTGSRPDEKGQVIKSFEAKQWKVINVPKTSYLMDYESRGFSESSCGHDASNVPPTASQADYEAYAGNFFDTEWANFEDFPDSKTSCFSFYMLENRQAPKSESFSSYNDRSRQIKDDLGRNVVKAVSVTGASGNQETREMRLFRNANDFSTYVLVTGKVTMDLVNDAAGQVLGGDVQYLIHLGDWSSTISPDGQYDDDVYSGFTNYNTIRNTSYNYIVTVNSVNNIRVEVETDAENQPGATGWITIAKEEIAICDAHYVSKTLTFSAKNYINGTEALVDDLTWRVKTPFSEGQPTISPSGEDIPTGLDYKWVHFRLNKKDGEGHYFVDQRRKYTPRVFAESNVLRTAAQNAEGDGTDGLGGFHNDGAMDIIQMVKYIKTQVKKYADFLRLGGNLSDYGCDFDSENPDDAKICVTVFVDEYYYDSDPVFGGSSPTLWKRFVNANDRTIHILCNSSASSDLESRSTGSVITIQQKSIKSIYNTNPEYDKLRSAWGLESVDEFSDKISNYNTGSSRNGSGNNDSAFNGRANSVCEWDLTTQKASSVTDIDPGKQWNKYLNFEVNNETPQMQDSYKSLRYFCMARNRDNNGNGVIERDEIRWYLASIRQLVAMYIGNGVLESNVALYNRSAAQIASPDPNVWRQHVISSTKYGSGNDEPTVVWGEEGISTGSLSGSDKWGGAGSYKFNTFTIRCVRNLGIASDASLQEVPQDYITRIPDNDYSDSYTFECTHINDASLRYYTSRELDFADQTSEVNRLYKKFRTAPSNSQVPNTGTAPNFRELNETVNQYGSSVYAGICPEGYRLPNQMEMAVIRYYTPLYNSGYYPSRTYWSLGSIGYGGSGKDGGNKTGFSIDGGNVSLSKDARFSVARCVQDIRVE